MLDHEDVQPPEQPAPPYPKMTWRDRLKRAAIVVGSTLTAGALGYVLSDGFRDATGELFGGSPWYGVVFPLVIAAATQILGKVTK